MNRAYSLLTIKSFDDDRREFDGLATTPSPDRLGDVVEPAGAKFTLPIPLLWQHDAAQPIGEVFSARPRKDGIPIKGRIFKATESRTLMERLDEAWESIKIKLVRGLSIGFNPLEVEDIKSNGWRAYRFVSWEWLELSAVTIPANADASIQVVKSIDAEWLVASDQRRGIVRLSRDDMRRGCRPQRPGVVFLD